MPIPPDALKSLIAVFTSLVALSGSYQSPSGGSADRPTNPISALPCPGGTTLAGNVEPAGNCAPSEQLTAPPTVADPTPPPATTEPVEAKPVETEPGSAPPAAGVQPTGGGSNWKLNWSDEFTGNTIAWGTKWQGQSSALADGGRGNKGNQQLEYNLDRNCAVRDGVAIITAKREKHNSYDWTSCLLTSSGSQGAAFKYGFIESRAKLTHNVVDAAGKPVKDTRGFWPGFWTWQAPGINSQQETDVYEQYSDNPRKLHITSHVGNGGGCEVDLAFDPGAGFHTYGADISAQGTKFYIDGKQVCSVGGAPSELTNLIEGLYVYSRPGYEPNPETVSAQKAIDYVRVWQR